MGPATVDCPALGTARAARIGKHPTIVYSFTEGPDISSPDRSGTLSRYDVTTGQTTQIVHFPGMVIDQAQLSTDGQWILFTVTESKPPQEAKGAAIELVRIDGQDLQTLYCAAPTETILNLRWSPDQKLAVFTTHSFAGNQTIASFFTSVSLLDLVEGTVQTALLE